jgi:glyoxylase I family protein
MTENKSSLRFIAVRYQVKDVDRAIGFYTKHLGFKLERKTGPVGQISNGDLLVWLSGPEASGSRPMPDGSSQEPGGWNRIALQVGDLPSIIEVMKKDGLSFRNEIETGPVGSQILLEDPDGNPIELFQWASEQK